MKVYYFNDTNEEQRVYVRDLFADPIILKPASGQFFELNLKENELPFIKVWKFQVLISNITENLGLKHA